MKIPSFGETKPQKRIKNTKKAEKVAKKPILREKLDAPSENQSLRKTSRIANLGDKAHRWTAEEALAAAKKGGRTFAIRNALRKDFERSAAEGGKLSAIFEKALNSLDLDLLTFAEKAAKMVGATFDQSPDAKQKIEVDGKMDNTLNVKISEA